MKVPDEVRKTVGFIAYQDQLSKQLVPVGSIFFLGHNPKEGASVSPRMYAVTARHVIDELRKKGVLESLIRLNSKDTEETPTGTVSVLVEQWFFHPTDATIDVAIFEMGIPDQADHLVIPFGMCATDQTFSDHEIALGDEVFISGLFRHHFGIKRNIPIVRIGNLAALNEERVETKSYGEIDAYLVEARSTGGLSGSPVFLNLGIVRQIGGQVKHTTGKGPIFFLLGLVHGHFDVKSASVDASPVNEAVNAGIAIVVPASSISKVIDEYERMHPAGD
jgi:hypothetical protein